MNLHSLPKRSPDIIIKATVASVLISILIQSFHVTYRNGENHSGIGLGKIAYNILNGLYGIFNVIVVYCGDYKIAVLGSGFKNALIAPKNGTSPSSL